MAPQVSGGREGRWVVGPCGKQRRLPGPSCQLQGCGEGLPSGSPSALGCCLITQMIRGWCRGRPVRKGWQIRGEGRFLRDHACGEGADPKAPPTRPGMSRGAAPPLAGVTLTPGGHWPSLSSVSKEGQKVLERGRPDRSALRTLLTDT